jgi:MinD superfamily P-loop ATPase
MIITIASGKGGTGKTTVAVNLALAQSQKEQLQLLDCDVEEPNSHIFLKPVFEPPEKAFIPVPEVDDEKCTYCGRCKEVCAFNAIAVIKENVLVFSELCHGCGGCAYFCPEGAITEDPRPIGIVESASVSGLRFIHGRLNPGEAMAPPLISLVKDKVDSHKNAIIDSPPGTSCPVVTAVKGSDYCLLVTEPTPFGLNDLSLAVEMLRKLGIPFGVLINRADSGNNCVDDYCKREGIPVLMRFPWDIELARLYAKGEPVVSHSTEWRNRFEELWRRISKAVNNIEAEKTTEERS